MVRQAVRPMIPGMRPRARKVDVTGSGFTVVSQPMRTVFPIVHHQQAAGHSEHGSGESVMQAPACHPYSLHISVVSNHDPIHSFFSRSPREQ